MYNLVIKPKRPEYKFSTLISTWIYLKWILEYPRNVLEQKKIEKFEPKGSPLWIIWPQPKFQSGCAKYCCNQFENQSYFWDHICVNVIFDLIILTKICAVYYLILPVIFTFENLFINVIMTDSGCIGSSFSVYKEAPITPVFKRSSPKSNLRLKNRTIY